MWHTSIIHDIVPALKKIEVIVDAALVDKICESLHQLGIDEIIATDVKSDDNETSIKEVYRGTVYEVSFISKVRLELIVFPSLVLPAISGIMDCTGHIQSKRGKVIVSQIEREICIETGEVEPELTQWLH